MAKRYQAKHIRLGLQMAKQLNMKRFAQRLTNTGRLYLLSCIISLSVSLLCLTQAFAHEPGYQGVVPNYAAQTHAMIEPCFGALLSPKLISCYGFKPRRYHGHDYKNQRSSVTIDCDRDSGRAIADKIRRVRSGGTVKFKGAVCRASLEFSRSVNLIGTGSTTGATVLQAVDGLSCVRVNPSAIKVTITNLVLVSRRGGQNACIQSTGSEVSLENIGLRYEGDAAALMVYNGRLNMVDSYVAAKSRYAAVVINNGSAYLRNISIGSTADGLRANLKDDSEIQGLSLVQLGDWNGFARGEDGSGVDIKLDSSDSILNLDSVEIYNFAKGLSLSGNGEALVSRAKIEQVDMGMSSSLVRLRAVDSVIMAREIGIQVSSGIAYLGYNRISGVRVAGMLSENGAQIRAVDNRIDALDGACGQLKWGDIEPSQRTCTPWYKGSAFDTPAKAEQPSYEQYRPVNYPSSLAPSSQNLDTPNRPVSDRLSPM
jgi:hypothetical protein